MKTANFMLNNKTIRTAISVLLIVLYLSSLGICAWYPDTAFFVSVDAENIPQETVYIDLLMPISSTDKGYVAYNEDNGSKYQISKNSEIVNYCENGYRSYTFHMVDADSNMQLHYVVDLYVNKQDYDKNKELLDAFAPYTSALGDDRYYYSQEVFCKSEKEQQLDQITKSVAVDIKKHHLQVKFNNSLGRDSDYDLDYCRQKYKHAKMAYLDKDGNVISVSNAVKIGKKPNKDVNLGLTLSGQDFTMDLETGPNILFGIVIMFVLPFFAIMIIVIIASNRKVKKL